MNVSALLSVLSYGALFGPIVMVLIMIVTYVNERNQAEIDFLRTVQEKLYLQHTLREAELKELHAQIKPHFLFNTLNTIRGLVLLGQRQEAMAIVDALAASFRYALQQSGQIVSLRDELRYVRSYLAIQQTRFSTRLTVDLQVDAELIFMGIPYMALQTLVENALEHGVEAKTGPSHVAIHITRSGEQLKLAVTDNGEGTRYPVYADLMELSEDHPLLTGVGLRNVRERLRRHYPDQCSLWVCSYPGQGWSAQMVIPAWGLAEEGEPDAGSD